MMHDTAAEDDSDQAIPIFPKKLTAITGLLTFVLVFCLCAEIWSLLRYLQSLQEVQIPVAEQSIAISDLDQRLTLVTYLMANTGEERWSIQHKIFKSGLQFTVDQLENQIKGLKTSNTIFLGREELNKIEQEVFDVLSKGNQKKAYELLKSEIYIEGKQKYQEQLFKITGALSQDRDNQLQYQKRKAIFICAMGLVGLFSLFIPWFFLVRAFLKSVHDEFEVQRDLQRMTELQESQKIATAVAHQAGMAEIATGVLHNVGNILNGVNIGAENIQRIMRESVFDGFRKANNFLQENKNKWGDFFLKDPKGSQIFDFYNKLEIALSFEFKTLQGESSELLQKIQLVKDVVNLQQNHAKGVEFKEEVYLQEIVENVLTIQINSLTRHDIKIIKKFSQTFPILAQKAKLAHVLLNIVKNAKEALLANNKKNEMVLTIEIGTDEGAEVFIKISDNGIGISPENITKIFNYGFTTKNAGHGFGLHHSANAVAEMDGRILVHSEGLDQGTAFILKFKSMAKASTKAS